MGIVSILVSGMANLAMNVQGCLEVGQSKHSQRASGIITLILTQLMSKPTPTLLREVQRFPEIRMRSLS